VSSSIIVDDLKHANDLARSIRYRTRIVTLEGDVVNPGGSMTGGGARKTKSSSTIIVLPSKFSTIFLYLEDTFTASEAMLTKPSEACAVDLISVAKYLG
jgi:chromosome segregation protein